MCMAAKSAAFIETTPFLNTLYRIDFRSSIYVINTKVLSGLLSRLLDKFRKCHQ